MEQLCSITVLPITITSIHVPKCKRLSIISKDFYIDLQLFKSFHGVLWPSGAVISLVSKEEPIYM